MNEYTSTGIKISIADESRHIVATRSLSENTEKETLIFTDHTNETCPLDIVPLRNGTCGVLARFVRIYPNVPLVKSTTVPDILQNVSTSPYDTLKMYFISQRNNFNINTNDLIPSNWIRI